MWHAAAESVETDEIEHFPDSRRSVLAVQSVCDVAVHGHVREQGILLEHHAHPPLLGCDIHTAAEHDLIPNTNSAGIRRLEPGDRAQRRRLAATRRAEQAHNRPLMHREVESTQCGGAVVGLRQTVTDDGRSEPSCRCVLLANDEQEHRNGGDSQEHERRGRSLSEK